METRRYNSDGPELRSRVVNDQGEIEGVQVGDIADDSLLARAGLKPNDRLVSVNGTPISSAGEAAIALREISSGGPVSVGVDGGDGETNIIEISAEHIAELNSKP